MDITVHTVNAFVDDQTGFAIGGNPAGVVLDADDLTAHQRQALAARLGLSETVFVGSSASASRRLEFFTPTQQIAHCGHATIAAFWLMQHLGQLRDGMHSKETIDGNRAILIEGTRIAMEQSAPTYTELASGDHLQQVLDALQLKADDLMEGPPPAVVHTGNAFLVVGVRSRECLAAIQPQLDQIERLSHTHDLIGFYAFCLQTDIPGRHAAARMFAPRYGINEEAATGMAAGPLACWLHDRLGVERSHFVLEQGRLMPGPSPSLIDVSLDIGASGIERLWAGGTARLTHTQQLSLSS
ncbi:PhzF family phenazine biosynthesis protein [Hydrogenophaga palleronii]|uniref:PhzF family phenazine biosynthesis protein n=1 Tax=Hydrogenophaga palleronii TaxID=65655 RepID=A0ABU1WSG0_9BURK|nr:PhzF family phenazine biosynthesis protein [Hydrogenophaga palleronii]MDR7151972.1 PhzF family phenazine biosynthesis protein [Hydrogenophaga palleronii]